MTIALTKSTPPKYRNYTSWLTRFDSGARFAMLDQADDPLRALESCNGLLLPGGADVDPVRYGKSHERDVCAIDLARDELEFRVIERALELRIPILGICRGLQIMNVALGGTLITDLPSAGYDRHHKIDGNDRVHEVSLDPDSRLARVIGRTSGETNSAHHQCTDLVAPRLRVTARSDDGIIEGLEWKEAEDKPYLLLVQWHPERMADQENPFAKKLASDFLSGIGEHVRKRIRRKVSL